jgi:type IV secretion system protein VirD4
MNTDKIKKHVLPHLPYAMVFWFFNKCGEAYRLSESNDAIRKLMDALSNLNAAMANSLLSFNPQDLVVGLIAAAAIYAIVWNKKRNAKNWRKDIEYGSARWSAYY